MATAKKSTDGTADDAPARGTSGTSTQAGATDAAPSANPEGELGGPFSAGSSTTDTAAAGMSPIVNDRNTGPTAEAAENEAAKEGHRTGERPMVTRAEGEVPGTVGHTAPGDAPHDTTDPRERVVTATPSGRELAEAAKAGIGSVVAYAKVGEIPSGRPEGGERTERYEVPVNPLTGETVTMERDLDTGVSRRVSGEADQGPHA